MNNIQFRKAEVETQRHNLNEAIELLRKAIYHAKEFDLLAYESPGEYTFSAPLFNRLNYDSTDWYRTGDRTLLGDIKQMCNRKSLEALYHFEDYQELWK